MRFKAFLFPELMYGMAFFAKITNKKQFAYANESMQCKCAKFFNLCFSSMKSAVCISCILLYTFMIIYTQYIAVGYTPARDVWRFFNKYANTTSTHTGVDENTSILLFAYSPRHYFILQYDTILSKVNRQKA